MSGKKEKEEQEKKKQQQQTVQHGPNVPSDMIRVTRKYRGDRCGGRCAGARKATRDCTGCDCCGLIGGRKKRKTKRKKKKKNKTKKKSKRKRRKTLKKNKYQDKCVMFFKKYHKITEKKALKLCKKMFKK